MPIQRDTSGASRPSLERLDCEIAGSERRLLRLVAEQKAIPSDQLARFLQLPVAETMALVDSLREVRAVGCEQLLSGEAPWVWLRRAGAVLSGTGFQPYRPRLPRLFHMRQINEVRLRLESGEVDLEWVCERRLHGSEGRRRTGFVPDAVVRFGGEVHAIEVELTRKSESELELKLATMEREYDAIVYFTTATICRYFGRLGLSERHPKLVVREITKPSPLLSRADWRVPGDPPLRRARCVEFAPAAFDVAVLDLLAEQQAIPIDQLAAYLEESEQTVEELVQFYLAAGLVRRARPVPSEPSWVWPTERGMAVSRHRLSTVSPRIGALEALRALNEVRLVVARHPDTRWLSGRVMRAEQGMVGSLPKAVVEVAGERHAIDVWLTGPAQQAVMNRRLVTRSAHYDALVWFYSRRACARIERFAANCGSRNLVVRPLPEVDLSGLHPGARGSRGRSRRPSIPSERSPRSSKSPRPSRMFRVAEDCIPAEALDAAAGVAGVGSVRLTGEAWRREGRGSRLFRLETDAGVFRVIRSAWGWRATRVVDESAFELVPGPVRHPRPPRGPSRGRYEEIEPRSFEFGEDVWDKLRGLIPPIEERPKARAGRKPLPDRVVLSGIVYLLRSGTSLRRLRRERGYGTGATIKARITYWEELEVWDPVREALVQALPDGRELDWPRLGAVAPRSSTRTGG
jgi:transposase